MQMIEYVIKLYIRLCRRSSYVTQCDRENFAPNCYNFLQRAPDWQSNFNVVGFQRAPAQSNLQSPL